MSKTKILREYAHKAGAEFTFLSYLTSNETKNSTTVQITLFFGYYTWGIIALSTVYSVLFCLMKKKQGANVTHLDLKVRPHLASRVRAEHVSTNKFAKCGRCQEPRTSTRGAFAFRLQFGRQAPQGSNTSAAPSTAVPLSATSEAPSPSAGNSILSLAL